MISRFSGEYRWLSNFWLVDILYEGRVYASVEHAYQAAKTDNPLARQAIAAQPTPGAAKRAGQLFPLRKDWDDVKLKAMENLLRIKFADPGLRRKLLDTNDELLVEGNVWGDTFWGICDGTGENHLGKLLMKIREELKREA